MVTTCSTRITGEPVGQARGRPAGVMGRGPLLINVADLLREPGRRRPVSLTTTPGDLDVSDGRLDGGSTVELDGYLEAMINGLVLVATVRLPWTGECRRCLRPISAVAEAQVRELFSPGALGDGASGDDADVWPVAGDQIDVTEIVREAVLLDLPLAPLCRADCRGLCAVCGVDRNATDCGHDQQRIDLRWGALEALRAELAPDPEPG